MSRRHEMEAEEFLFHHFKNSRYKFERKVPGENGFDLWMVDSSSGVRTRAELKAHTGIYKRKRDLVDRLVFNSSLEKDLFQNGSSILLRVFLGSAPPTVFIITNRILLDGARLELEPRYGKRSGPHLTAGNPA